MPARRASLHLVAVTLALGLVAACTHQGATAPSAALPDGAGTGLRATVERVVDGDTVDLSIPGRGTERARLLGIDTPETVKPDAPVDCYGPEASARTKHLLPPGTAVAIQRDAEVRDRYGRLLVYLWRLRDGLFVNRDLLARGFARVLSIAPNTARAAELAAASAQARTARLGVWGRCR